MKGDKDKDEKYSIIRSQYCYPIQNIRERAIIRIDAAYFINGHKNCFTAIVDLFSKKIDTADSNRNNQ
jgi:hypothetical protein